MGNVWEDGSSTVPAPGSPPLSKVASPVVGVEGWPDDEGSSSPPVGPEGVSAEDAGEPSAPELLVWEDEEAGPSAAVADSPVEAPSPPAVEDGAASVVVCDAGAGVSWTLDPLEGSASEDPAEEDSAPAWADSEEPEVLPSGAPDDVASCDAVEDGSEAAEVGSEAAGVASPAAVSWALATPTGSSTNHAIAASSQVQNHALDRPFLEEPATVPIIRASP